MKEVKLQSGEYIFIEIPNDAYEFNIVGNNIWFLRHDVSENDGYGQIRTIEHLLAEIISTTKDITEEMVCSTLEYQIDNANNNEIYFKNYSNNVFEMKCAESLQSLIQSLGLDINKNYLILLKKQ